MQFSNRLTMATHILLAIEYFGNDYKITSDFLATSVNTNPVNVRYILSQLKKAGIISVNAGTGGASIIKDPDNITMLDIFKAVEDTDKDLFHFHENPNPDCPVGKNMHKLLDDKLEGISESMYQEMSKTTLNSLIREMHGLNKQTS
ncbi:MAG: Rrf2 family transcriptional regulator [Erysipelotrichaceae bacterium]|nr:Rrf2 family transcriptional regulator [Erysipelotrichaceae bacterium]